MTPATLSINAPEAHNPITTLTLEKGRKVWLAFVWDEADKAQAVRWLRINVVSGYHAATHLLQPRVRFFTVERRAGRKPDVSQLFAVSPSEFLALSPAKLPKDLLTAAMKLDRFQTCSGPGLADEHFGGTDKPHRQRTLIRKTDNAENQFSIYQDEVDGFLQVSHPTHVSVAYFQTIARMLLAIGIRIRKHTSAFPEGSTIATSNRGPEQ